MKEICSTFEIIPIGDILNVTGNEVIYNADKKSDILQSDLITINLQSDISDSGLVYSLSQDIVIDKVSTLIATKYNIERYCILVIHYTDGSHTIYGTPDYPVSAYITPGIFRDTLSVSLQTTISPII